MSLIINGLANSACVIQSKAVYCICNESEKES